MEKTDIVILNWLRDKKLKHKIIPKLIKCKFVNNIIISHGRKDTFFDNSSFSSDKVICLDHSGAINDEYGLSLRFIAAKHVTTKAYIFIDDDIIFTEKHINDLIKYYYKKPDYIHGYIGRKIININNKYYYYISLLHTLILSNVLNRDKISYIKYVKAVNSQSSCNIALTQFMILPKESVDIFWNYYPTFKQYFKENSKPLWNGEDIFINLIYIKHTNKKALIHKPYKYIGDTISGLFNGISSNKNNNNFRNKCVNYLIKNLKLDILF